MPRPKKSDEMPLGMAITMTVLGALILLLVVWAFIVPFVWMQLVYRPVEATVIDKRIAKERWGKHRFRYRLQALLFYEVPRREYREWVDLPLTADSDQGPEIDAVDKQVEIRQKVPAFYDPYHPTTVVLERASLGWSLIPGLLCPSLVLAGGVAGLVSIRRKRNAIAAGDIPDVLDPAKSQDWNEAESVVVDRGERLPVRLRSNADKALDELPCLGCGFAPFVVILLIIFTEQWRAALPPGVWPGIVIAVVLLILFLSIQGMRLVQRRLRLLTLEISQHPLRSGESYRVSVAHPDPAALSRLRLELKCKESDSRTSGRITHRQPIVLDESGDTVRTGRLDLPDGLPPTLKLAHHEVQWSFEGGVGRWLRWPLRFPVRLESAVRAESDGPAREKRLDEDCVSLWIDTDAPASEGTTLRGGYLIRPRGTGPLRSAELSVLWYTPPPGEEVRKILHEEQHAAVNGDDEPLYAARRFEVRLPDGPPSYEGKVVIIRWAVRLRLRYADGEELVRELPFAFTSVPSAEPLPAAAVSARAAEATERAAAIEMKPADSVQASVVPFPSTLHPPPSTHHPPHPPLSTLHPPRRGSDRDAVGRALSSAACEGELGMPERRNGCGGLSDRCRGAGRPVLAEASGGAASADGGVELPVHRSDGLPGPRSPPCVRRDLLARIGPAAGRFRAGASRGAIGEGRAHRTGAGRPVFPWPLAPGPCLHGPFRLRISRSLRGLERFVVQDSAAKPDAGSAQASGKPQGRLCMEREGKAPVLLLYEYPWRYLVGLAEDLRGRIRASAEIGLVQCGDVGPVAIVPPRESSLDRHNEARELGTRRLSKWTVHLGGVVGLGALTAAVDRTGGFGSAGTWLLFGVAWMLAIALFWGPHKSGTA